MLEHQAFEKGLSLQIKPKQTTEFYEQESITPPQQVRPTLSSGSRLPGLGPHGFSKPLPSDFKLQPSDVALLGGRGKVFIRSTQETMLCFQEILDSLAELYSLLQEEDMWAGLWQKRCKYSETATAIAYEQHGFFEQVATTQCPMSRPSRMEEERWFLTLSSPEFTLNKFTCLFETPCVERPSD